MHRLLLVSSLVTAVTAFVAPTPSAAQQSFNISLGGFVPAGEDSRTRSGGRSDDVLVNNLNFLAFDFDDLSDVTLSGEWLAGLGSRFDAGVGLGIYSEEVPAVYADLVNEDLTEIRQDLKLRIVPLTFTIRFLPVGREAIVKPYIGAGVGIFWWRYAETGEFVDFSDLSIYRDSFSDSGGAAGPVIVLVVAWLGWRGWRSWQRLRRVRGQRR